MEMKNVISGNAVNLIIEIDYEILYQNRLAKWRCQE